MLKVEELNYEDRDPSFQSLLGHIYTNRETLDLKNFKSYENIVVENNHELLFAAEDFIVKSNNRGQSSVKLGNLWIKINAGGKASFDAEVYYLDIAMGKKNLLFSYSNKRYAGLKFENMFPFDIYALYKNPFTHTDSDPYGKTCLLNTFATRVRSILLDMATGKKGDLTQTDFKVAYTDLMTLHDVIYRKQNNTSELTGLDVVDFGKNMSTKPTNKREVAAKITASFFLNIGFQDGDIDNIIHEYIEETGISASDINKNWISSLLEQYVDKNRYRLRGILTKKTLEGCIKSLKEKCEKKQKSKYEGNIDEQESMSKLEIEAYVKLWTSVKDLYDKRELIEIINTTKELFATIVKTFTDVNVNKQEKIQTLRKLCCKCRDILIKNKSDYLSMVNNIDANITNLEEIQSKSTLLPAKFKATTKNIHLSKLAAVSKVQGELSYLTELRAAAQKFYIPKVNKRVFNFLYQNRASEHNNSISVIEKKEDIKNAFVKFNEEYIKNIMGVNKILSRTGFSEDYIQPVCKWIISLLLSFFVFLNFMSKKDSIAFLEKYFPPPTDFYDASQKKSLNTKELFLVDSKNLGINDLSNSELLINKRY